MGNLNHHRTASRFRCPTSVLNLNLFSRDIRLTLAIASVISFGIHILLAGIDISPDKERAAKPLVSKFIKREPRLVKPLELKKRPKPKPRVMKRQMVKIKAKVELKEASSEFWMPKVLESLSVPKSSFPKRVVFSEIASEPGFSSRPVLSSRLPEEKIDMSMEMLDVDALDVGRYHAVVIQDPRDKKKVTGFFHLAIVYSKNFNREEHHGQDVRGRWAIQRLVKAVNK